MFLIVAQCGLPTLTFTRPRIKQVPRLRVIFRERKIRYARDDRAMGWFRLPTLTFTRPRIKQVPRLRVIFRERKIRYARDDRAMG
jgi:hypothetical protein